MVIDCVEIPSTMQPREFIVDKLEIICALPLCSSIADTETSSPGLTQAEELSDRPTGEVWSVKINSSAIISVFDCQEKLRSKDVPSNKS